MQLGETTRVEDNQGHEGYTRQTWAGQKMLMHGCGHRLGGKVGLLTMSLLAFASFLAFMECTTLSNLGEMSRDVLNQRRCNQYVWSGPLRLQMDCGCAFPYGSLLEGDFWCWRQLSLNRFMNMIEKIYKVSSQNIRGFGDPHQGKTFCKWVRRHDKELDVLCLQELKAQKDKIDFQLQTLFQDSVFEVDYSAEGRGGAALVVFLHLKVLAQGKRWDDTFSWCTIESSVGPVSIGSIYVPNDKAGCIELWEWLHNFTHQNNWLMMGDWNMVELHDDTIGPSTHLHGIEERGWINLVDHLDLIDLYMTTVCRKGPIFTRQAQCGVFFDKSRLDRVYSNNRGNQYAQISSLEHDSRQMLSDHIPITVIVVLVEEPAQGRRKGTYTKMDHTSLDDLDFQACIQIEWDQSQVDYDGVDPCVRWEKAWKWIKHLFQHEKKHRKERAVEEPCNVVELQQIWEELTQALAQDHDPLFIR